MGSWLTTSRDSLIRPLAFPAPSPSYDHELPHLKFINDKDGNPTIPIIWIYTDSSRTTLLFSHRNGCDLGHTYNILCILKSRLNVNIVAYDYPGYGLHKGTTTEQLCYQTIDSVLYYMNHEGIHSGSIVLIGQSIGTGPTSWLSRKMSERGHTPKSTILISPFTSAVAVMSNAAATVSYSSHMVSESTADIFDSYYHLQNTRSPVQIIHGKQDGLIPYSHGVTLSTIAPNALPIKLIEGAGHNDMFGEYLRETLDGIWRGINV